jgi:hypothetical protein
MTKSAFFTALCITVSVTAFGAPRPETSTYVDGNVSSLKPNTGGTLVFTDDTSMTFRTGLAEVAVPYSSITRAELGATQEHNHDMALPGPLRMLKLPLGRKTETQLLTLEFKNGLGEKQTMTLSLAKPSASNVISTIEERTGKPETALASAKTEPKEAWWGDSIWKTNRNLDTWNNNSASNK